MSEPAVIDLGLDRGKPEPPPRPAVRRRRRWSARARWGAAAATMVLAFPLAGAAQSPGRPLERIWSVPATGEIIEFEDRYVLGDGRLYEVAADRLVAYRLADGEVEWEVNPDLEASLRMRLLAGTLVVVSASGNQTDGFDAGTGEHLWSFPVGPSFLTDERLLLVSDPPEAGGVIEVDPRTGETRTRQGLEYPPDSVTELAADGAHQFRLATDGTLTRVDLDTGATTQVQVPHHGQEAGAGYDRLWLEGDLLVARSGGDGESVVTAYNPVTLTQLWSAPGLDLQQCHRLLCVESAEGSQPDLRTVEPATGEAKWTLRCPQGVDACGDPIIQELPGNRLWVTVITVLGEVDETRSWVADAATGQPLTLPTNWQYQDLIDPSTFLLYRVDPAAPGRTWWAWADADLGRLGVLGGIDAEFCDVRYPYLVCVTEDEVIEMWRFGS